MQRILNHLIQLQDLCLMKEEQKALVPERQLSELNAAIVELKGELPNQLSRRFQTLQKRYHTAVVPVVDGACTGCGAVLPTAIEQQVATSNDIHYCPMCSRILYWYKGPQIEETRDTAVPVKRSLGIARFSAQDLFIPKLGASNKEKGIKELAKLMADKGFIFQMDNVIDTALKREAMISTSVGSGLAFPHARGIEGCGLTLAMGIKKEGLDWNSPDGKPVQIIGFMVIPTAASAFYLELIAGLMSTFREKINYEKFLSCTTTEEMWETIIDLTKDTVH